MSKKVFEQVTDQVTKMFTDSISESLIGLAHHAYWTLTKERDSHIVILEKGAFTTTKMAELYMQSNKTAVKSGTENIVYAISSMMLTQLTNHAKTNWTLVNEDKICTIELGAPNTNPYLAILSNGHKVGYMNMHRVMLPAMPISKADQLKTQRDSREKILNFTLNRAVKSIAAGILSGNNKLEAQNTGAKKEFAI